MPTRMMFMREHAMQAHRPGMYCGASWFLFEVSKLPLF